VATGNSLVGDALRKIGRLASGETATTAELADGVVEINRMLSTWTAQIGPIFSETLDSLTWTSGNASRTIGSSGDFNTARPVKILAASYRDDNSNDYSLGILTHQEYQAIGDKTITGSIPSIIAYNPTYASSLGTLFIYPVPTASVTIRLISLKPLSDLTGSGTVALPPAYEDAIVLNLALRLTDEYGIQPSMMMIRQAALAKRALVEANLIQQPMQMDPLTPGQGSSYTPGAGWVIP
jgi:hypothetical protein